MTWNPGIPDLTNQISADIPDIEENFLELLTIKAGLVFRSQFAWKDGDEIYIDSGTYHHEGSVEQVVFWNSQLTFQLQSGGSNSDSSDYGADGWHYIYLDDSAIVTLGTNLLDNTCFLNLTGANTAPVWTTAKHGWYGDGVGDAGTNDKCIFAVYETGNVILEFFHAGDMVCFADQITERSTADLDVSWVDVDMATSVPGFSTRANVAGTIEVKTADANVTAYWRTNDQSGATGHILTGLERIGTDQFMAFGGVPVILDSSQVFEVSMSRNGDDTLAVVCDSWFFPIGM